MSKEQPINLNISDFLKVFAVASVILQTVLSYVLTHSPQTEAMNSIGSFYRMSKYSAPMFIFAIIYNMVLKSQAESYLEFLKEKFYELVLPYVVWSSLYLYAFPSLQQRMPYETPLGFLGKVLSGDGAAHLWYAVMMLQFQLFMPYFIWLATRITKNKKVILPIVFFTIGAHILWCFWYQKMIFPYAETSLWYLIDRSGLSYLIYGIFGVITAKYQGEIFTFLKKTRVALFLLFLFIFWQAVQGNLFDGTQMTPNDLPYLDPLQSAYSLLIIGLVFYLGTQGIAKKIRLLPIVKWIATYAYRSYLANVFVFQLVLKLVHPFLTNQPVSLVILVLYMGTFVGSFGLTVVVEYFFKSIFKLGRLVSV